MASYVVQLHEVLWMCDDEFRIDKQKQTISQNQNVGNKNDVVDDIICMLKIPSDLQGGIRKLKKAGFF